MSRRSLSRRLSAIRAALVDPAQLAIESLPESDRAIFSRWKTAMVERLADFPGDAAYRDFVHHPENWPALPPSISAALQGRKMPVLTAQMDRVTIADLWKEYSQ